MSLLSDTQGSADRIWSLLRLVDALGGTLQRDEALKWLAPPFGTDPALAPSAQDSAVKQTVRAAASLGLVRTTPSTIELVGGRESAQLDDFAEAVHQRLCALSPEEADYVVLEAYAAVVVLTEKYGGTQWLRTRTASQLANTELAEILRTDPDAERRFNSTKFPHWVRWLTFLGLGIPQTVSGGQTTAFYPTATERLQRALGQLVSEANEPLDLDVATFLARLGQFMPYLDGGVMFNELCQRARLAPMERRLSRVLSNALRDLHDDERLKLITVGDSASMYRLAKEPHPVMAITAIRLFPQV